MANSKNLVKGDAAHSLTAEEQSIGGKKSGETRRKKADMRKAVENILNSEYSVKGSEEKISGIDALALNLFKIAQDTKNKQCISATRLLLEIYGQDKSPMEQKMAKAQLDILKAKAKLLKGGDENTFKKLDDILASLENTANEAK